MEFPKGLVGELASFILAKSPRPVREVALAGALAFVAGIAGRSYQIFGTGLNLYLLLLARTGSGKEAVSAAYDCILSKAADEDPSCWDFLGPSDVASFSAHFSRKPSFVSVLGEFGLYMRGLYSGSKNRASPERRLLLDLFSKSGRDRFVKFRKMTRSPALTLFGESTPERFYESVDESLITEGFLPRFVFFEYNGERVPFNAACGQALPSDKLQTRAGTLIRQASSLIRADAHIDVAFSSQASALLSDFSKTCDERVESGDFSSELWNRAHLNALKIAGLCAVGVDAYEPKVDKATAEYAIRLVEGSIESVLGRFREKDVRFYTEADKRVEAMRDFAKDFHRTDPQSIRSAFGSTISLSAYLRSGCAVPSAYLKLRAHRSRLFSADGIAPNRAIKEAIDALIEDGFLVPLDDERKKALGLHSRATGFELSDRPSD